MRLLPPAPLYLLWSYRRRAPDTLTILKAGHAFRVRGPFSDSVMPRRRGRFRSWLTWFPLRLVKTARRYGPAARDTFGRPIRLQIADMVRVAIATDVMPDAYYVAGLAELAGRDGLCRDISYRIYSNNAELCHYRFPNHGHSGAMDGDKLDFELTCRGHGIASVETIVAVSEDGRTRWVDTEGDQRLPAQDLFLKPSAEGQGRGADRFDHADGRYASKSSGAGPYDANALLDHARRVAGRRDATILLQKALINHPEVQRVAGNTIATARIVTIATPGLDPDLGDGFWRVSGGVNMAADNYHQGGLMCQLDLVNGRVGRGRSRNYPARPEDHAVNPVTGAQIDGFVLPDWNRARDLVLAAHRTVATGHLMGWDVAFTPTGPLIVEASAVPGYDPDGRFHANGFINTVLAERLAMNTMHALARFTSEGSRWRVGADLEVKEKALR